MVTTSSRDQLHPPGTGRAPTPVRRAAYLTAAAGTGHVVLFLAAAWLLARAPGAAATDAEVTEFYASAGRRGAVIAGLYLMPFAAIAYLWFVVMLRDWARGHGSAQVTLASKVQLGSAILYAALFLAAAGAAGAVAASVQFAQAPVDPPTARILPPLAGTLLLTLGLRMAAVFVISTVLALRQANLVPGWFAVSGYAVGTFLLLSIGFDATLVTIFPAWLLALCALLALRAHRLPPAPQPRGVG